jgi:tetratricopeptide (TPR) repeat protein
MKKKGSLLKTFQEIAATQDFTKLDAFRAPESWDSLTVEERENLANLFLLLGESQLKDGNKQVFESFSVSEKLLPNNAALMVKLAEIYSQQPDNGACLKNANKLLEKAISLDPTSFQAYFLWGNVLVQLGIFHFEANYFIEADGKYTQAEKLLTENQNASDLYWQWGFSWFCHGKHAGEAIELRKAVEKYRQAKELGASSSSFWNDFGNALVDLGYLIERHELFKEAVEMYQKSVDLEPTYFEGWINLACSLQHIYNLTGLEEIFKSADTAFEKASTINYDYAHLWYRWGFLYVTEAKRMHNMDRLKQSLQKFEKAFQCDPQHPGILGRWGDAQILFGSLTEDLTLLRSGEAKIVKSLELAPDSVELWVVYGTCLNELGRYFGEEEYYAQAIEKFQYALSIDRKDPLAWYGLALSHYALGELHRDATMLEKCIRYCSNAVEFAGEAFPQFWNDWGVALMRLAEMTHDRQYLESAVEKFVKALNGPNGEINIDQVSIEWVYNYGAALDFLGEFTGELSYCEQAAQVLSQVVQFYPEHAAAHYNLALTFSHIADLKEEVEYFYQSLDEFETLLKLDPEDEFAWTDWGLTLINLGLFINDSHISEKSIQCYEQAEAKLQQAIALGNRHAYYHLACLYSLNGNYSASMHFINKANTHDALPSLDELMHDEWLDGLRKTQAFRHFINQLVSKQSKDQK